jgi:hypothetical protein
MSNFLQIIKHQIRRFFALFGIDIHRIKSADFAFPSEATPFQKNSILKASKYSITGVNRMWALTRAFEYIQSNAIEGDYVECGVWQGGNLILLAALQDQVAESRVIYGFDTFEGMTEPSQVDRDINGMLASDLLAAAQKIDGDSSIHVFASLDLVNKNLVANNAKNIKLVKGDVAETLLNESNLPKKIAILRLDTDWYESTKVELEVLYPLLQPGGVLIIDDYGHFEGARKAVDEYFKEEIIWMENIDYSCRLIIKR